MWVKKFVACLFLIPTIFIVCLHWLLPQELQLAKGESVELSFQLPITAKTEESIGVLGVSTKPLADEFQLHLGTSVLAEPTETGITEVTFYLCDSIPIKTVDATVVERISLVPIGKTVGISLETNGLLVLETGSVTTENDETVAPAKNILQTGDLLLEGNGQQLINKETLSQLVSNCNGASIELLVSRNGETTTKIIEPIWSEIDQQYKIGIWLRDSIQGIGTITYYNPETGGFGGLGHGVYDVDTGDLMEIKGGTIYTSLLTEIVQGKAGTPGELRGSLNMTDVLGEVYSNTTEGIYGVMAENMNTEQTALPVALNYEIEKGSATILANIEGTESKEYAIEITGFTNQSGKDMEITITDPELLAKTGGIVQGISGSPILQNGKIVGAVTHVLVNDPTRGYGIYIQNMLSTADTLNP
ncbi:SpoIVB peptidase [Chakrabartyella piscis]|uniref:SpoIVB peptidase n=1 Tax=Chakrabartyella piscis TaxID=2918914 RepID=UPI0029584635|nr:SpoIVB peptidase [Chakrabartyella piscis]